MAPVGFPQPGGPQRLIMTPRVIGHVDMDAFFASVEQRDNPALRGKPVLVGGGSKRGVVAAASYEARRFGCKSAMPTAQALRLCPQAIIVKGRHGKYGEVSKQVFEVVRSFTPDVQPISIDEAFFDLTNVMHLHAKGWDRERAWEQDDLEIASSKTPSLSESSSEGSDRTTLHAGLVGSSKSGESDASRQTHPPAPSLGEGELNALRDLGVAIKRAIRDAVDLPASIGISGNKFLAKFCSDLSKPDGLKILRPQDAERELLPLPVGVIFGVGPKAQERLRQLGIKTIAEMREFGEDRLVSRFGEHAREWFQLARGEDHRPLRMGREQKSIGKERTFFDNIDDPEELRALLLSFVEDVARSLREDGLKAKGVTVKLRLGDFSTFTRSRALAEATDSTKDLWAAAWSLLQEWIQQRKGALRLMGVSLHGLTSQTQMGLFEAASEEREAPAIPKRVASKSVSTAPTASRGVPAPAPKTNNPEQTRELDGATNDAVSPEASDVQEASGEHARELRRGEDAPARGGDRGATDAKGEANATGDEVPDARPDAGPDSKGAKKRRSIDAATDAIAKKFGKDAIRRGGAIG
jgi:nucleotidyltransferase/DNA polymerase involved in DNA repair